MTLPTMTRRESIKRGLSVAAALALFERWDLSALAQGEVDVPFTDIPATFAPVPAAGNRRMLDLRRSTDSSRRRTSSSSSSTSIAPPSTAAPIVFRSPGSSRSLSSSRSPICGRCARVDLVNGYECSGIARGRSRGSSSNGRFTGVRLRDC